MKLMKYLGITSSGDYNIKYSTPRSIMDRFKEGDTFDTLISKIQSKIPDYKLPEKKLSQPKYKIVGDIITSHNIKIEGDFRNGVRFTYLRVIVPLAISNLEVNTKQNKIRFIEKNKKDIDNIVLSKIKEKIKIPINILRLDNLTLTNDNRLVYVFGVKGDIYDDENE